MRRQGTNWPIAFASLTVSVMLWFVVYAQNMPEAHSQRASLVIDGLNDRSFFVRKIPTDVRLLVNAPAERDKDLAEERITASVDLSEAKEGIHEYPVVISPDWVRRYVKDVPTVRVEIERVANRTLPISGQAKGSLPDKGLQIVSRTLSPKVVIVYGPASEVNTVQEVRAFLDLSAINPVNQEPQETDLIPLDAHGSRPPDVQTIPRLALYSYKIDAAEETKPVTVVLPALEVSTEPSFRSNGYRIDPPSVDLRGKPSVLANVSKVYTEPVQVSGLTRDRTVRVRLVAPAGTTIVGPKEVSVTYFVLPAPTGGEPKLTGEAANPSSHR